MKPLYSILAAVMFFGTAVPRVQAAVSVSVDFFHDHLESYGDWREVGDYGYCWQPRNVDRDWRPYSDGHWVYTDAGWTWDSEEPYSWAVYHYGRWARVDRIGWVWVPGTEWGPAWVSWRRGSRHVGWAPLPPEARFSRSVGFSSRVDADYDIGPTNYTFVEVRNFGAPRLRTVMVEPRENITIIHQTTNITRITYVNNVVYNEGPQYEAISRESAQPIRRLKLERREDFEGDPRAARAEQLRSRVEGDSLRVLALPIDAKPATAPRKVAAKVEKAEVDRGWKNAGPAGEVSKLRTKIKSEPATSAELPTQPKIEKTAEAPAESPVPSTVKDEKAGKGRMRDGDRSTSPTAPVTAEAAPGLPDAPAASDKPAKSAKSEKGAKPVKPEVNRGRSSPPTEVVAAPSRQSKKDERKGVEAERGPAEALPQEQIPGRKPMSERVEPTRDPAPAEGETAPSGKARKGKNKGIDAERPRTEVAPEVHPPVRKRESVEPSRNMPPATAEPPSGKNRPEKGEVRSKREQPAVERIPEPRPQASRPEPRQPAAPAVTQPQPLQPAKAKGKGKNKDEKKDGEKPVEPPQ